MALTLLFLFAGSWSVLWCKKEYKVKRIWGAALCSCYMCSRSCVLTWNSFVSSQTACNVVLLLNHAVSVCELQQAGDAALQQAGAPMQARIIGEMERVGEHLFPCICFTLFCLWISFPVFFVHLPVLLWQLFFLVCCFLPCSQLQ